jgi:asparagine synthase (glutamine-hydrolysing)
MMMLSRLVRQQGYKVVLTGEGADEALGGYDIFKEAKIRAFWARNPASSFRPLLLKRLYPYLDVSPGRAQAYLQAFFGAGIQDPGAAYFSHIPRWNTTAHCKLFFSQELNARLREDAITTFSESLPRALHRWHPFNKAQYIEAKSLMAGYLLCSQGDRMLMANSVEGRFPFLDHRVIEFANQLHPNVKMKVLNEKYILKKAMQNQLPQKILNRFKQPYRAPDIPAFFNGEFRDYVQDMMAPETVRRYGYFDDKKVAMLMRKILAGRSIGYKDNMAFVGILSTQVWHSHFIADYFARFGG